MKELLLCKVKGTGAEIAPSGGLIAVQRGMKIVSVNPLTKEEKVVGYGMAPVWTVDGCLSFVTGNNRSVVEVEGGKMLAPLSLDDEVVLTLSEPVNKEGVTRSVRRTVVFNGGRDALILRADEVDGRVFVFVEGNKDNGE